MASIDAERALALVGAPFRTQGRDPATGLDCLGLVLTACGLPAERGRRDYRLRGEHRAELLDGLARDFRRVPPSRQRIGDLLVIEAGEQQLHLGILTARGFVHADARLRSVVETPGRPRWPVISVHRRQRGA